MVMSRKGSRRLKVSEKIAQMAIVALAVGAGYYFFFIRADQAGAPGPPGWDDLILCSKLTSLDSKKTLSLNEDFSVRIDDSSAGGELVRSEGRWTLLDPLRHEYSIEIAGSTQNYIAVSPPHSDGCLLAAGSLDKVDLQKSWFTTPSDPPERGF
jgi:hypothetical protein